MPRRAAKVTQADISRAIQTSRGQIGKERNFFTRWPMAR